MANNSRADISEDGVCVRVLLPDGGQTEAPEEQEEDEEVEETEEAVEEEAEGEEESEAEDEEAEGEEDEEAEDEEESEAEDEETEGEEAEDEEDVPDEREEAEAEEGTRLLHLHLDGLFLDLLGLEVNLEAVTLDLTAIPGDGNLLGNLLSAVSGLLDGAGLGSLLPDLGDLLPDLGGLLGGGGEEGDEDDEEGEGSGIGMPSLPNLNPMERARAIAGAIADKLRELLGSVIKALPLEELLTQFIQEVVSQLFESDEDDSNGDEEAASA